MVDDVLLRKARRGDREAVERLMALLLPRVRRWARTHVEDADDADDVAQATLINAARGLTGFDLRARLDTWVQGILRRCVADHYRATRRRERGAEPPIEPAVDAAEPDIDGAKAIGMLRRAFLELPSRQREAFDLVDLQGMSAEEASLQMGLAINTVRVHLHRARRELRRTMIEREPAIAEDRSGLFKGQ